MESFHKEYHENCGWCLRYPEWEELYLKLRLQSDSLFGQHFDASSRSELYHREAENLTFSKELYWTLVWKEYTG